MNHQHPSSLVDGDGTGDEQVTTSAASSALLPAVPAPAPRADPGPAAVAASLNERADTRAPPLSPAVGGHGLSLQELANTSRNGKKKKYWSAFEVVIATTTRDPRSLREHTQEARYDAYAVNHSQLKKIHDGHSGHSSGATGKPEDKTPPTHAHAHGLDSANANSSSNANTNAESSSSSTQSPAAAVAVERAASVRNYVRVECKYCTEPRFTQSISVSTKKFEDHYRTFHALESLAAAPALEGNANNMNAASANKNDAQATVIGATMAEPSTNANTNEDPPRSSTVVTRATPVGTTNAISSDSVATNTNTLDATTNAKTNDDTTNAKTNDDATTSSDAFQSEHVIDSSAPSVVSRPEATANQAAAPLPAPLPPPPPLPRVTGTRAKRSRGARPASGASVTMGDPSAGPRKRRRSSSARDESSEGSPRLGAGIATDPTDTGDAHEPPTEQHAAAAVVALSAERGEPCDPLEPTLDAADSETKRAKKSYWTAFDIVITESISDDSTITTTTPVETRKDAWRVNHNALRRLHLDPLQTANVRVECRLCDEPKFSQSITVSTKKFEHHVRDEHREASTALTTPNATKELTSAEKTRATQGNAAGTTGSGKRRRSWKSLMGGREPGRHHDMTPTRAAVRNSAHDSGVNSPSDTVDQPDDQRGLQQRSALLNWLLRDCLSPSVVDSPSFHVLMTSMDAHCLVPSASNLTVELMSQFLTTTQEIKTMLKKERAVGTRFALAVERFSTWPPSSHTSASTSTSMLSVAVTFVSSEWRHHRVLVACRSIPVPGGQAQLSVLLGQILDEFALRGALSSVTTSAEDDDYAVLVEAMSVSEAGTTAPEHSSFPFIGLRCAAASLNDVIQCGTRYTEPTSKSARMSNLHGKSKNDGSFEQGARMTALMESIARAAQDLSAASPSPDAAMVFLLLRYVKTQLDQFFSASQEQDESTDGEALKQIATAKEMHTILIRHWSHVLPAQLMAACVLDPRVRTAAMDAENVVAIRKAVHEWGRALVGDHGGRDLESLAQSSVTSNGLDLRPDITAPITSSSTASSTSQRSLFEELLATANANARPLAAMQSTHATPIKVQSARAQQLDQELDSYLSASHEALDVDVLAWWKAHATAKHYPMLACVARHTLGLSLVSRPAQAILTPHGRVRALRRAVLSQEDPVLAEAIVVTRAFSVVAGGYHSACSRKPVTTANSMVV